MSPNTSGICFLTVTALICIVGCVSIEAASTCTSSNENDCRLGSTPLCSGRGICSCGTCECEKRANPEEIISGPFCECDNFSCARSMGQICSGPDNGVCSCGMCLCEPGWTGEACDCSTAIRSCVSPIDGEICSGHGECVCGACNCETGYTGKYCEKCPTCPYHCEEYKACVQCQMYRMGPLKEAEDCAMECTKFTPIAVEKIEIDESIGETLCRFYDEDDCQNTFKYSEVDNKLKVYAAYGRECPQPIQPFNRSPFAG